MNLILREVIRLASPFISVLASYTQVTSMADTTGVSFTICAPSPFRNALPNLGNAAYKP